ncbi:hypothetical protein [Ktedonospora formicarum]|uniref:VCBS repeat-containing protein n=1 Tax=Ktedonospora formicarum TaxID=2778364 RepID=A0A8J3HRZ8_9CHLR|nr:hypothetical protein [Ktedonospora formicarum]GHO42524.1 hypothetical protein KSX_06870 [Ktedonospora formicarum]
MPVLSREDELDITPRSIVRHRPIKEPATDGKRKKSPPQKQSPTTMPQRASRALSMPVTEAMVAEGSSDVKAAPVEVQETEKKNKPSTSLKSKPSSPKRAFRFSRPERKEPASPLLFLGLGMLVMLVLWIVLSAVLGWWNTMMDDWRYGRPRTFQIDAQVGHNEQTGHPSHFLAINLDKQIQIIELQGGDPARARIYVGPQLYGEHDDLVPITLSFVDLNSDKKPDMIIHFQQTRVAFVNDSSGFRPVQASEQRQIDIMLRKLDV